MSAITQSGLTISIENNIQIIRYNNPRKKNAIQFEAYRLINKALQNAAENSDISFTVLTGTGEYYSSGFDISDAYLQRDPERAQTYLKEMIDAFINHPKLIVALVNGPAIGIAVTTLGLCDIVYCSDKATFTTPFSKLGLCAEGCASFTFPRILGKSKANEMLLTGHQMSAQEAYEFGFVSKIFKHSELNTVWETISKFKKVSQQSIQVSKKLTRKFDRDQLLQANQNEIEHLKMCFQSEDFANGLIQFLNRKSKL